MGSQLRLVGIRSMEMRFLEVLAAGPLVEAVELIELRVRMGLEGDPGKTAAGWGMEILQR